MKTQRYRITTNHHTLPQNRLDVTSVYHISSQQHNQDYKTSPNSTSFHEPIYLFKAKRTSHSNNSPIVLIIQNLIRFSTSALHEFSLLSFDVLFANPMYSTHSSPSSTKHTHFLTPQLMCEEKRNWEREPDFWCFLQNMTYEEDMRRIAKRIGWVVMVNFKLLQLKVLHLTTNASWVVWKNQWFSDIWDVCCWKLVMELVWVFAKFVYFETRLYMWIFIS